MKNARHISHAEAELRWRARADHAAHPEAYSEEVKADAVKQKTGSHPKEVAQYSLDGTWIKTWDSVRAVAESESFTNTRAPYGKMTHLGLNSALVRASPNRATCCGYSWGSV
jgi:hypothetical protein